MNNQITHEEWAETNRKVSELFQEIEENAIRKMPLWMRMNYYNNKLSKAINEGHKDEEVKWGYINEMLIKDLSIFDYNMFKPVYSFEGFSILRFDIISASEGIGPWHKHKCKDCGEDFYMTINEVMFYRDKELQLPKRCKECREKRRSGSK